MISYAPAIDGGLNLEEIRLEGRLVAALPSGSISVRCQRRTFRTTLEESKMPYFLVQASYGVSAVGAMVKNPQDRSAAIRPLVEKLGGKLHGMWLTFGDYDLLAIVEMPDAMTAASFSMAVGASGAMSSYRTTPLLTMDEAVGAMKKAGTVGYQAPK